MEEIERTAAPSGWVLLDPASVPERWAERVVPMAMVPLTADEAQLLLSGEPVRQDGLMQDADLMRLVARGLSAEVVARRLGLAPRSVYRRLARLREAFGVQTTAQLTTELARRGFGVSDPPTDGRGPEPTQANGLQEGKEASS